MIGATETRPATKKELQEETLTVAQSSTLHRFSNANAKSTSAEQTAALTIVPVRMEANAQSAMPMMYDYIFVHSFSKASLVSNDSDLYMQRSVSRQILRRAHHRQKVSLLRAVVFLGQG